MTNMNRAQRRAAASKLRKKNSFVALKTHDDLMRQIYNSAPSMIHENDYTAIDCVLCNAPMQSVHDTHDARPLAPSQTAKQAFEQKENIGRCCSKCNVERVIPSRHSGFEMLFAA